MLPYLGGVQIIEHDLTDALLFAELMNQFAPVAVYNLAAFSSVGRSWAEAELTMRTNAVAVVEMLESVLRYRDDNDADVRFFQASSAEVFGGDVEGALDEQTPHRPRTPYAIAKSAAHHSVVSYREKYGMFACNGILFNHESPFRGRQFIAGKIAHAAADALCGGRPMVVLGDIDVQRDWGAAADYVELMRRALGHDHADDYVVATGSSHTLREMLAAAFGSVGLGDPDPYVTLEPSLWSSSQASALLGNPSKATKQLGWSATTSFEALIADMVDVDVRRIRSGVEDSIDYLR
jgi:GDPmannose 4,6-dehydratase